MKFNRIVFLDIDGVLNSERTLYAYENFCNAGSVKQEIVKNGEKTEIDPRFDPIAVKLLQNAQEKLGFKIVISSAWRYSFNVQDFHILFNKYNWDTSDIIIGKTGYEAGVRGNQIKCWIDNHTDGNCQYAIIDDSTDMLDSQLENFVRCDFKHGFDVDCYIELFSIFGESEKVEDIVGKRE